jgi:hypothetical protein
MSEPLQPASWDIERRGSDFALVRTEDQKKTELPMTETDLLSLSRIFPSYAHGLLESKNRPDSGVQAWLTIPVKGFASNIDLYNQTVLLMLTDETETEFGFAFDPDGARQIADHLVRRAQQVEKSASPSSH